MLPQDLVLPLSLSLFHSNLRPIIFFFPQSFVFLRSYFSFNLKPFCVVVVVIAVVVVVATTLLPSLIQVLFPLSSGKRYLSTHALKSPACTTLERPKQHPFMSSYLCCRINLRLMAVPMINDNSNAIMYHHRDRNTVPLFLNTITAKFLLHLEQKKHR